MSGGDSCVVWKKSHLKVISRQIFKDRGFTLLVIKVGEGRPRAYSPFYGY